MGVGAWQIYEEINPTLERALWKEGLSKNLISPGLLTAQEVSSNSVADYLSNEKYGCFQWFFPGANPPESTNSTTNSSGTQSLTNPFSGSDSNSSSSPVLGCTLMRMVPKETNKFFLKSEITFKNDTQGWAIWTHLTNYNKNDSNKLFIYFRILFLGRNNTNETWTIKGGVYLRQYGSTVSGNPSISAPDGTWSDYSKDRHYSGFWENDSNGKKLMEEIKMEYGQHNKLFNNGDIYTSTDTTNSLICDGIYEASNNKWTTFSNSSNCCISGALTQAFNSFKDKKGKWTEAKTYCNEVIKVRYKDVDEKTKARAKELCYLQTTTPK